MTKTMFNTDNLLDSISNVLMQHDKTFTVTEINSLITRWHDKKYDLINKLRNHPNWNEDALAVILTTDETREIGAHDVYQTIHNMMNYAYESNITFDAEIEKSIYELQSYPYQFIDTDMKNSLQQKNVKSNEGQKVSRLLNSIFTKAGLDKLPEYNRLYAKIADAYNPLTIKRTSILSVHPCDFLHMSNGTGWKSCHNIDDGCYMAGTLSYMCDEVSLIFYTIDNEYSGDDFYNQRKITRNVFCYYDTMLLQSRLYPTNDDSKKKQYRELVQQIFSVCDSIPNLWINKPYDDLHNYYTTNYDSKHYPDYEYKQFKANISLQKGFKAAQKMVIGSTSYCLECGETITDCEKLYCDYCTDDRYICDDCGERIHNDDAIYVNGYYYCRDCVSYCDRCNEYTRNEMEYINGLYVCEHCLSEHYIECEDCGKYIDKDDVEYYYYIDGEDKNVCSYCFDSHYTYCEDCDEIISRYDAIYVDGEDKHVCEDCFYNDYFRCEECGQSYSKNEISKYNNMTVCHTCYDELEENDIEDEDMAV